jgi:hypothetical protein
MADHVGRDEVVESFGAITKLLTGLLASTDCHGALRDSLPELGIVSEKIRAPAVSSDCNRSSDAIIASRSKT